MGRRSSRPSGGRRAAPRASSRPPSRPMSSRTASPPPRRSAPPPATTAKPPAKQGSAQAPPPAAAAAAQPSAMGGFMANVASTGLGVMAGRAMDRTFFGGGSGGGGEPVAEEGMAPPGDMPPTYGNEFASEHQEEIPMSVCAREALEFKKCMERTGSDVASCQWNLDILAACQQQQQQTGFADTGRL